MKTIQNSDTGTDGRGKQRKLAVVFRPSQLAPRLEFWVQRFRWLLVALLLCLPSNVHAQPADPHSVYLPLITPAPAASNPVHQGIATYYDATGAGACSFDATPNDLLVTAMNAEEYADAAYCGAYLYVTGPLGSVTVRVVDLCPECRTGHLDLSQEAFAQIANPMEGRVAITWQLISPAVTGPIAYHFKEGSNQWWTAVQVRNHRNPIARLEYRTVGGDWIEVPRTDYNYFVQTNPGMGPGPYTFRVTDWYGHVLEDSGIAHMENGTVAGSDQFPPGP
ncbi:MAG TPA: hypothetical protein DCL15_01290 [Chloroflexi bacterium]|nr:hypothetical protein [Chloroflexota bacterium]HHW85931.1 hypothetical protein [Chloroflexota bacterium]